jgi:hypothetical protein
VYTSFQPALQQQKDEREGNFAARHTQPANKDTAISDAILSDLREVRRDVVGKAERGGFAWGIRQALFGPKETSSSAQQVPIEAGAAQVPARSEDSKASGSSKT